MCPCSAKPYAVLCSVALRGTVHNSAVCITALCTRQGSEIIVDHGRSCSASRSHTYPRGAHVAGHKDLNSRTVEPQCHSGCRRRTRVVMADGQGQGTLLMVRSTKHAYAALRRQLQQRVQSYYLVQATSKTVFVAMLGKWIPLELIGVEVVFRCIDAWLRRAKGDSIQTGMRFGKLRMLTSC